MCCLHPAFSGHPQSIKNYLTVPPEQENMDVVRPYSFQLLLSPIPSFPESIFESPRPPPKGNSSTGMCELGSYFWVSGVPMPLQSHPTACPLNQEGIFLKWPQVPVFCGKAG
jgi:hypothetical protein